MKKLLIFTSLFSIILLCISAQKTQASTLQPLPLISRNVPAISNSAIYPASQANSSNYGAPARIGVPGYLAYDLSSVPVAERSNVVLVWYNDATYEYDHTISGTPAYNNLGSYTIDVNPAPGGTVPTSGWITIVSVSGNHYHSRQHAVSMAGYNWIRINVTASDGSAGNSDAAFKMDVYNAANGITDDWIFYGDSITANIMHHAPINSVNDFSQLINVANPSYFPIQENGGIPYLTSTEGAANIYSWITLFPGRFVGISYGTNDANGCMPAATYKQSYTQMIQAVTILGKIAIIPHIPWAPSANVQKCAPALNSVIDQLYAGNPSILKGPDLWSIFQNHPEWFQDQLHPNPAGEAVFRNAWANAMTQEVYNGNIIATSPTATPVVTQAPTLTPLPSPIPTTACSTTIPMGTSVATLSNVTVPSAGTYHIFTRMMNTQSGDGYYLQIDNTCPTVVSDTASPNAWNWVLSGTLTDITNGTHTITLYGKDANIKIDELLLSQSCVPTGDGTNCTAAIVVSPTNSPTPSPKATPILTNVPTVPVTGTITPTPSETPVTGTGSLTYVTSAMAKGNFGNGVPIVIPTGVQAGDLLIATAGTNGQAATWSTPVGWNAGIGSSSINTQGLYWFWKVATGTEDGTTMQLKSATYADGGSILAVYRGAIQTQPIAGVSTFVSNTNSGSFKVKAATVNDVTLPVTANVVPLVLVSWQHANSAITWPTGFVDEAGATDGYGHIEIGEGLTSLLTNHLSQQTLNFATVQAVIQTLQIAVQVK